MLKLRDTEVEDESDCDSICLGLARAYIGVSHLHIALYLVLSYMFRRLLPLLSRPILRHKMCIALSSRFDHLSPASRRS
jgi:hypothetical protein